ncbi:MAG TPA: outer membrane beta-barrel protein [Bacteroidia bacterium]|nr:outer membrane beta-barrel protein [Bacteroidia bacterium]
MKRLLLMLPLFIIVSTVQAQRFRVGVVAGAAITDIAGADLVDNDNDFVKAGLIVGGLVNTKIGATTQMQLEISFIQRGSQVLPDTTHMNDYYIMNLNYINVSLSVRQPIHININRKMTDKYGLIFGLTYGSLLSYSYTIQGLNYLADLNTTDANAFFGFYYNFTPNFFFDLRYSNSFIPVIKRDGYNQSFYPWFNSWNAGDNMAFELRLGYTFGSNGETSKPAPDATPAQ